LSAESEKGMQGTRR